MADKKQKETKAVSKQDFINRKLAVLNTLNTPKANRAMDRVITANQKGGQA